MAADITVNRAATTTLGADVVTVVNITGDSKTFVEFIHHNDDPAPAFFQIANTEAGLDAITAAGDDLDVIVAGERVTFPTGDTRGADKWIALVSAGEPTITIVART